MQVCSYLSAHRTMYIQLFTYLGSEHLILPSLVTEFDKVCIHNSGTKQLYIYCKACLWVSHIVILHTIHTLNNYSL